MVFRSKVDSWLVVAILLATVAPWAAAWSASREGGHWAAHALLGAAMLVFLAWLLAATSYTVDPKEVVVRCGPLRWRIGTQDIDRITPDRSLLAAPALSLDRLRIDYRQGRKSILVSPADKAGFITAVQAARKSA